MKKLIITLVAIAMVSAGAWFYLTNKKAPQQKDAKNAAESSGIIARVNGEDIVRDELETAEAQIAAQMGMDVKTLDKNKRQQLRTRTLDTIVANILIRQAAAASGIKAPKNDVNAQLQAIKGQFQSEAQFRQEISKQGMTEDELRSQIAENIVSRAYLATAVNFDSAKATKEEINAFYKQQSAAAKDMPPLKEVREQIKSFIVQRKQQRLLALHIEKLRAASDIEILY